MIRLHSCFAVMLVLGGATLFAAVADARGGNRDYVDRNGYVTAESRFGNGVVSGPIRETRTGLEVRLPSGSWTACRRSCTETLRVQTVDYYENNGMLGYGTVANECGIFGCLDIGVPRRSRY